jgi:hypothetical protein
MAALFFAATAFSHYFKVGKRRRRRRRLPIIASGEGKESHGSNMTDAYCFWVHNTYCNTSYSSVKVSCNLISSGSNSFFCNKAALHILLRCYNFLHFLNMSPWAAAAAAAWNYFDYIKTRYSGRAY